MILALTAIAIVFVVTFVVVFVACFPWKDWLEVRRWRRVIADLEAKVKDAEAEKR